MKNIDIPRGLETPEKIFNDLALHTDVSGILEYKDFIKEIYYHYAMTQVENGSFSEERATLVENSRSFILSLINCAIAATIITEAKPNSK